MKKLTAIVLLIAITFTLFGCGYKVPQPMSYPDYTFDSAPSTDQLRETAVRAMQDILTIQWQTGKEIKYKNNGANHKKIFVHEPGKTYGGLLYATASTGIFQFFEYYNEENGCLEYEGTADELKLELGCTCADSVLWGWTTVCNSISGGYYPTLMVPANGYIPVGDYKIPDYIQSYHQVPSYAIIEMNGEDLILDAYTKMLPADVVISYTDDHAMMITKAPTVVYKSDGSIDTEESYVILQDQRAGGDERVIDGETVAYNGRVDAKATFAELLKADYIPLTAAEFIGTKEYEKAQVSVSNPDCSSMEQLAETAVTSNYHLALINIISENAKGKQTILHRELFKASSLQGVPKEFSLSKLDIKALSPEAGSTVKVEVVVASGERFYPIEFKA